MQRLGTVPWEPKIISVTSCLRRRAVRVLAAFCTVLVALAASCGEVRHSSIPSDASSDGGGSDASPPTTFFVGGHVMGLAGSGLVLQNNAADDLTITADGTFVFPAKLVSGGAFDVTVKTQPMAPKQSCVVSGGKGLVANGNVTTVAVNCTTDRFTIGGTVSGLAGAGLVLQDNAGDAISVNANGEFAFPHEARRRLQLRGHRSDPAGVPEADVQRDRELGQARERQRDQCTRRLRD